MVKARVGKVDVFLLSVQPIQFHLQFRFDVRVFGGIRQVVQLVWIVPEIE
jgi:hypothetical protein